MPSALGNSVEQVAGFVGHRNPQVTQDVYIAMTQAQRRQMLDCPWLTPTTPDAPGVREEGRAMAAAICSPFGSPDGRTFPRLRFAAARLATEARQRPAPAGAEGEPPVKRRGGLVDLVRRYLDAAA